ncbi:DinB family protein [Paenibacillus albiflavus]|uniref:DinB family protein n=1 Tax=Paenibacillus albiflavus TaxID=2545760 RepID=A0A4R4ELQ6_9BACL|nr:DinB family protein [Paenibacillus albiflavus]TCZ79391.1 DinB family protein [Paenibacillus albiflavus]
MSLKAIINYQDTTKEIATLKEIEEYKMLDPIKEGKWSIREIIGHLHYWDKFILEQHIPFMAQGANLIAFPDHDSHNNEGIQYISSFKNVAALIDEFVYTRNQLFEAIHSIKSDIRFTIGSGKRQFTIESYIGIFSKHDIHHLEQIRNSQIATFF